MRPIPVLLIALVAVLFQGCIVKSLHPFFFEKDVVFKPELLNTWIDQDDGKWIISRVGENPHAYEMKYSKDGSVAVFLAHLFKLEDELYVDFLPISSNAPDIAIFNLHLLPAHSVAKIELLSNGEVLINWFNEEWLRSLFDHNRIKIAHEAILDESPSGDDDKFYVLTASTEELQKFLIKYSNDHPAFDGENAVCLKLKKAV